MECPPSTLLGVSFLSFSVLDASHWNKFREFDKLARELQCELTTNLLERFHLFQIFFTKLFGFFLIYGTLFIWQRFVLFSTVFGNFRLKWKWRWINLPDNFWNGHFQTLTTVIFPFFPTNFSRFSLMNMKVGPGGCLGRSWQYFIGFRSNSSITSVSVLILRTGFTIFSNSSFAFSADSPEISILQLDYRKISTQKCFSTYRQFWFCSS